jgi:hypothetical protein
MRNFIQNKKKKQSNVGSDVEKSVIVPEDLYHDSIQIISQHV